MWDRGSVCHRVAGVLALVLATTACTYELADPGTPVACGAIEVQINPQGTGLDVARRQAVIGAVAEFGVLVGRPVVDLGNTAAVAAGHAAGDPLLVELYWPGDAPTAFGFGSPVVAGGSYREGWIYLNPLLASAPVGVIRRVMLHELGHVYGLDHVSDQDELMDPRIATSDYGPGDLVGLFLTHAGGCPGNTLGDALGAYAG